MSSQKQFGGKTTAQQVADAFADVAKGRTFLVTGAAAGIGFETARALASVGARVFMTARSQAQAEKAVEEVRKLLGPAGTSSAEIFALELDLSSLESIKRGAAAFMTKEKKLHVLINNAGVMASPFSLTKDGLEQQFGVNHVGHFHLTELLLPALRAAGTPQAPARVVDVSSLGHFLFTKADRPFNFEHLATASASTYKQWRRYGETKLMNVLHAAELTRRCRAANEPVIGVSLHPGAILATKLGRHIDIPSAFQMMGQMTSWAAVFAAIFVVTGKNVQQGASTTLVCALDPSVDPGGYYHNCQRELKWVHGLAQDKAVAKELWEFTERVISEKSK